jgi:acetylornithine deacetylase/succinyl-diaminopimelate desuccinylase-like protein
MKGGVAAFVEALRVLKSTGLLRKGAVLMTAHDHHEGPWGDKRQLKALIREGYVGDAVLLPEYLSNQLPLSGRGMGIFRATFSREGAPIHEVLRPEGLADVNGAGADFLIQLKRLNEALVARSSGVLRDSVFTGQIAGGEIYNQAPVSCLVTGTRRWVRPGDGEVSIAEVEGLAQEVAMRHGTMVDFTCSQQGDAFSVPEEAPIVQAFQSAYTATVGQPLVIGEKPFLDDGNLFTTLAGIPPITHGPDAKGAHTLDEAVAVDELVRVAKVYALTAIAFGASA